MVIILDVIITGDAHPRGSKIFAMNERIDRFVLMLVFKGAIWNRKESFRGTYVRPSTFNKRRFIERVLECKFMCT